MSNSNDKKKTALGEAYGTARNRLIKNLLFKFMKDLGLDTCFQCGCKIKTNKEMSIEHKVPWLNSEDPTKTFYDLENIAFSHLSCNCRAAERPIKKCPDVLRQERNKNRNLYRLRMTPEERKLDRRKRYLKEKS